MSDSIEPESIFDEDISRIRNTGPWQQRVIIHGSLQDFLSLQSLDDAIHTVCGFEAPIDFLLKQKIGRPLIICFHADMVSRGQSADFRLPVFAGTNLVKSLDVNFLAVSDPSLYLANDLTLAWFAGSSLLPLQKILPRILAKVIQCCQASHVIFVGGSGGGFASLFYSSLFPNSLALVWAPQSDIREYQKGYLERYGQGAFGFSNFETSYARISEYIQCDLAPIYKEPNGNFVIWLQNNSDWHIDKHLKPFLNRLGILSNDITAGSYINRKIRSDIWLFLDNWGEGHAAPPTDWLHYMLLRLIEDRYHWKELFETNAAAMVIKQGFERFGINRQRATVKPADVPSGSPGESKKAVAHSMNDLATTIWACPICGTDGHNFLDQSGPKRKCPGCGSLERHRVFASLYSEFISDECNLSKKSILHISPSEPETVLLRRFGAKKITTIDIRPELKVDIHGDISDMPHVKSESFDVIVASYVLTCVQKLDDCIAEFARILTPNGILLTCDPIRLGTKTEEFKDLSRITAVYGEEYYNKYRIGNFRYLGDYSLGAALQKYFIVKTYYGLDMPSNRKVVWYMSVKT